MLHFLTKVLKQLFRPTCLGMQHLLEVGKTTWSGKHLLVAANPSRNIRFQLCILTFLVQSGLENSLRFSIKRMHARTNLFLARATKFISPPENSFSISVQHKPECPGICITTDSSYDANWQRIRISPAVLNFFERKFDGSQNHLRNQLCCIYNGIQ